MPFDVMEEPALWECPDVQIDAVPGKAAGEGPGHVEVRARRRKGGPEPPGRGHKRPSPGERRRDPQDEAAIPRRPHRRHPREQARRGQELAALVVHESRRRQEEGVGRAAGRQPPQGRGPAPPRGHRQERRRRKEHRPVEDGQGVPGLKRQRRPGRREGEGLAAVGARRIRPGASPAQVDRILQVLQAVSQHGREQEGPRPGTAPRHGPGEHEGDRIEGAKRQRERRDPRGAPPPPLEAEDGQRTQEVVPGVVVQAEGVIEERRGGQGEERRGQGRAIPGHLPECQEPYPGRRQGDEDGEGREPPVVREASPV